MANILIINDDEEMRDLLEMMLTDENHSVTTAVDGVQGLAFFRVSNFDLIITDILMPNTDSMGFSELKNNTPILAMSGGRGTRLTKEILKKPFTLFDLRRAIRNALD